MRRLLSFALAALPLLLRCYAADPECSLGSTQCTLYDDGWRVQGCNTHEHLVTLQQCPSGWTCANTGATAHCVPPTTPAPCVPRFTVRDPGLAIAGAASELRFNISNSALGGKVVFCAAPREDGRIADANQKVQTAVEYSCYDPDPRTSSLVYRLTSVGPSEGLTVDFLITYECQGALYGALTRGFHIDWECTPVFPIGLLCGKVPTSYTFTPDHVGPMDNPFCLQVTKPDSWQLQTVCVIGFE